MFARESLKSFTYAVVLMVVVTVSFAIVVVVDVFVGVVDVVAVFVVDVVRVTLVTPVVVDIVVVVVVVVVDVDRYTQFRKICLKYEMNSYTHVQVFYDKLTHVCVLFATIR